MKRDHAEARCEELELAIRQLVEAWDAMPSGRSVPQTEVLRWLTDDVRPAVVKCRLILGRRR